MSQPLSAYDTTIYRGSNQKKEINAIVIALATGDLVADASTRLILIESDIGAIKDIPAFNHPLPVEYKGITYVAVDMRYFMRRNNAGMMVRINEIEYDLALNAALLNARWLMGNTRPLMSIHTACMATYANTVANVLSRRLQLDMREQNIVRILFAFFYACQFFEHEPSDTDLMTIYRYISRSVRIPEVSIAETLDGLRYVGSLGELCKEIGERSQSVRLARVDAGVVIQQMSNTWFGIAANKTIAVALEFPPVWIAVLSIAATSKIYRRTAVATTLEMALGRNDLQQFINAVKNAIQPSH